MKEMKYKKLETSPPLTLVSGVNGTLGPQYGQLEPYYITGFIEAEGSFGINIRKRSDIKVGYQIGCQFQITQHVKSIRVLYLIKYFFNCGTVRIQDKNCNTWKFVITNPNDIENTLIPFLNKYTLKSSKYLDYKYFISVFELIKQKKHITSEGVNIVKNIANSMNRKRTNEIRSNYYNSKYFKNIVLSPFYIQGFTDGEGCFYYYLNENNPIQDYASFEICKKSTEEPLLLEINKYFNNSGLISVRRNQENVITSSTLKFLKKQSIK